MLDDQTLIDTVLAITGRDLEFASYVIKADSGFSTVNIVDNMNNTILGAEYQSFNFYTSAKNCIDNVIVEGDLFSITDSIYVYNFKIANDPIMQTDGWARFPAAYIDKVGV
jgi:hypothetical protein